MRGLVRTTAGGRRTITAAGACGSVLRVVLGIVRVGQGRRSIPRALPRVHPARTPASIRPILLQAMFPFLIGAGVAAGTYWYAKKQKKVASSKSAAAAAVTGAAGWGAAALVAFAWPVLLFGGAAAGIYLYAKKDSQKALPPASE